MIEVEAVQPSGVSPTTDGAPYVKPVFLIVDSYDSTGNNQGDERTSISLYGTGVLKGSFWYSAETNGLAGAWSVGFITITPQYDTAHYLVEIDMGEFSIVGVVPYGISSGGTPPLPLQTWSVDFGFFREYALNHFESAGEYYNYTISLHNLDTTDGLNGSASGELTTGDGTDVDFDLGEPAAPTDYQYSAGDSAFEYEWEITKLTGLVEGNYTGNYEHQTTVELNLDAYEASPVHNAMDIFFTGFCGLIGFALPYRTLLKKH